MGILRRRSNETTLGPVRPRGDLGRDGTFGSQSFGYVLAGVLDLANHDQTPGIWRRLWGRPRSEGDSRCRRSFVFGLPSGTMHALSFHMKTLLGLFLALLLSPVYGLDLVEAAAAVSAERVVPCARVSFSQPPIWTTSGVWNDDQLVLIDAGARAIRQYLPSGRMVGELPKALSEDLIRYAPSRIQPISQGRFLLELANDRLVTFSKAFHVEDKHDVVARAGKSVGGSGSRIESLYGWAVATSPSPIGDEVLGYGDIRQGQQWQSGFFRFPVSNPQDFKILSATDLTAGAIPPSRSFYLLGFPYITAIKDVGYVLVMENRIGLYRHVRGGADLDFVRDLGVTPALPSYVSKADLPSVMRAVEQAPMPVGIWGWENYLYILSRAPQGPRTRWVLTKVDPQQGPSRQVVDSIELPTQANHLTVVPGSRSWAFVEKGSVRAFGVQDTDSVLLVPAQALRNSVHARFVVK
jgi:hypothetical protein